MKETKKGITVTFKEEPNGIAALLTAYIKGHPGEEGREGWSSFVSVLVVM